jgi:hypothetical protein
MFVPPFRSTPLPRLIARAPHVESLVQSVELVVELWGTWPAHFKVAELRVVPLAWEEVVKQFVPDEELEQLVTDDVLRSLENPVDSDRLLAAARSAS